ncbi:MAG: hypothetical protein ACREFY_13090, partial [Acetobacteraceae bacterium]
MDGDDTELAASTNISDETAAVARDARTEDTTLAPESPGDETTILADETATGPAEALAWSDTEAGRTEPAPYVQRGAERRWAVVGAAVMLPLAAIAALGTVFFHTRHAPTGAPVPAPPAAVLDGTYRVEADPAKGTVNGAPDPLPNTDNTAWWAFRSSCTSAGCVATGTRLDVNNHQVAATPADTAEFHFVDGHWQAVPFQHQVQYPRCLGADGQVIAGADTQMVTWSLEPQPDGTLRGGGAGTTLTNECGQQGEVNQFPLVATRMGDVPIGVSMADPATVTASPTTSTAAPVVGGPLLDGTYSVDYEFTKQTVNGSAITAPIGDETHWWAFRSLCTSAGCVATGAALADEN